MGFHKISATRNMRVTRAHLDRKENGDIYAVWKTDFSKDAPRFEFCFIGEQAGVLTYEGNVIERTRSSEALMLLRVGVESIRQNMIYRLPLFFVLVKASFRGCLLFFFHAEFATCLLTYTGNELKRPEIA